MSQKVPKSSHGNASVLLQAKFESSPKQSASMVGEEYACSCVCGEGGVEKRKVQSRTEVRWGMCVWHHHCPPTTSTCPPKKMLSGMHVCSP